MSEARYQDFPTFPALDPRRAMTRLGYSLAAGLAVYVALWPFKWPVRLVASWDVLSLVETLLGWWIIVESDPDETRRLSWAENPGRGVLGPLVLGASFINLFAAMWLLRHAKTLGLPHNVEVALVVLCLIAVVCSWFLTHTTFGGHYLHLYFEHDEGLEFPGKHPPSAWDFAYFAFTLGMCFQVSDVSISSPTIRKAVLIHALMSFAYNTAILALAINLIVGLLT
ncbi:MAG: DUF1345 domain-containing protein [Deltaproteobacteria bacterium]|nr:DUF1345 domain-containing protein [Deltaproteobacteria bacterium]